MPLKIAQDREIVLSLPKMAQIPLWSAMRTSWYAVDAKFMQYDQTYSWKINMLHFGWLIPLESRLIFPSLLHWVNFQGIINVATYLETSNYHQSIYGKVFQRLGHIVNANITRKCPTKKPQSLLQKKAIDMSQERTIDETSNKRWSQNRIST